MPAEHRAEAASPPSVRLATAVHRYWYPLRALVRRELIKRYASTAIGSGWVILQPVLLLALYVTLFAVILRPEATDRMRFVIYLLCGMLPYLAMAEGLQRASSSLREDRGLLDRVVFPAEVIPASRTVSASITEAIGLVIVAVTAAGVGLPVSAWIVFLPLLVAFRILMTTGLAWVVSVLAVFLTDIGEVLSLVLTAWLFLTPIFYEADQMPEALRWWLGVNPLHHLVASYRSVLLEGSSPFPDFWGVIVWTVLLAGAGLRFFRKSIGRAKDFL